MPERIFKVSWPDGQEEDCYSPSSVIDQHLIPEHEYTLASFLAIATEALNEASSRVRQKYGYACSSAMDQLGKIEQKSKRFKPTDTVKVISIR